VSLDENKELVRRLVEDGINPRDPGIVDEVADGESAGIARRWVSPFQSSFPDFRMEIVDLITEGDTVVGHFKCSGTREGEWLGVAPTGRRIERVDEVYVFRVKDGKLSSAMGVEDNLTRMHQLGLRPSVIAG
jgi:predicted ester cyclase